jgi:hypothetical protein
MPLLLEMTEEEYLKQLDQAYRSGREGMEPKEYEITSRLHVYELGQKTDAVHLEINHV